MAISIKKYKNVEINDNFIEIFMLYVKRFLSDRSVDDIDLLFLSRNIVYDLKSEARYVVKTQIYIYKNLLIINPCNKFYKDINEQFKLRMLYEDDSILKYVHLQDEELFYIKLKYNVYEGYCDCKSNIELELEYDAND